MTSSWRLPRFGDRRQGDRKRLDGAADRQAGLRPAADHPTRPWRETTPRPCRGGGRSGNAVQARAPGRSAQTVRFVPGGDSPPTDTMRPTIAAAPVPPRGSGRSGILVQRFRFGSYASTVRVRVEAREPAADRVDPSAQRGRGEVLARAWAREGAPSHRPEVEGERAGGEPRACSSADDHDAAVRSRSGGGRGALLRERRDAAPATVVEERGAERRPIGPVAAEDHDSAAPRGSGGVVDRHREIGAARPGVACVVVDVDPPRVGATRGKPPRDDPVPERRRGDLCPGLGERAPADPRGGRGRDRGDGRISVVPTSGAAPRSRDRASRSGRSGRRPR